MNTLEQQLWDYIDGNLDELQAKSLKDKIEFDANIKLQYEELLALNLSFEAMELDEPSLSFTRNVMESVALAPAPFKLKTKVDTKIIYGIGSFFILALLSLLGYVVYHSNLEIPKLNFDFNWNKYITPTAIYAFLFADLVIGLVFLDYFLRKKAIDK